MLRPCEMGLERWIGPAAHSSGAGPGNASGQPWHHCAAALPPVGGGAALVNAVQPLLLATPGMNRRSC